MKTITVKEAFSALLAEMKKGNGDKKLLIGNDDEGNGFRPMLFTVSPTEGNVSPSTLWGVEYDDAIKNYLIIG